MVSVTLEGSCMVSDKILDFRYFVKFHRSGPSIIFNSWTIMEHASSPSKKLLIKPRFIRTSSRWWLLLWKDYGWFLIDFRFFVKLHKSGPAIIFIFSTISEHVSYPSKKLLIKPSFIRTSSKLWVLLWKDYGWFLRNFRFFVKFHMSGPAKIFSFWTINERISIPSKKLLIKPRFVRTSSRWWVLQKKDYGLFLIDFRFFIKFHRSGPAIIGLSWSVLVIHQKSS